MWRNGCANSSGGWVVTASTTRGILHGARTSTRNVRTCPAAIGLDSPRRTDSPLGATDSRPHGRAVDCRPGAAAPGRRESVCRARGPGTDPRGRPVPGTCSPSRSVERVLLGCPCADRMARTPTSPGARSGTLARLRRTVAFRANQPATGAVASVGMIGRTRVRTPAHKAPLFGLRSVARDRERLDSRLHFTGASHVPSARVHAVRGPAQNDLE